jgi:hypothetical protein
MVEQHPTRISLRSNLLSLLCSVVCTYFWLVVVLYSIDWQPSKTKIYFILKKIVPLNVTPNKLTMPLTTCSAPPVPPLQHSFYHSHQLFVDCCVLSHYGGHLSQLPSHLSLFDGSLLGAPNKGTNHGKSNPDSACFAWTHGELQCHNLGAQQPYTWRERAKPLEGRAVAAHVGYCVFFVFLVVACGRVSYFTYFVE